MYGPFQNAGPVLTKDKIGLNVPTLHCPFPAPAPHAVCMIACRPLRGRHANQLLIVKHQRYQSEREGYDGIISTLELQMMALKEQEKEAINDLAD